MIRSSRGVREDERDPVPIDSRPHVVKCGTCMSKNVRMTLSDSLGDWFFCDDCMTRFHHPNKVRE